MAGHIDKLTEDKIKEAANIVDVIGDFIELKKRGLEYQCLCPFHNDKTIGNFNVNPIKNVYKCFSCGAGGDSLTFLMNYKGSRLTYPDALRYLAKKYSISVPDDGDDDRWKNIKPAKPRENKEIHKEMLVMSREMVKEIVSSKQANIFIEWFRHLPWTDEQRSRVELMLWTYCVAPWRDGRVCFFQIDDQGRARGGKLMRYDVNGKRIKTENPGWVHNQDGYREQCDMEHHEFRASLFGLHLLNKYPNAAINIVESEKTALVCATTYGHPERNLWMACGGMKFLKTESLQPIIDSGRRVWLWPDMDGLSDWRDKLQHLLSDKFVITTQFLDSHWIETDGPKADVADIIIRHMTHPETYVKREPVKPEEKPTVQYHEDAPFWDPEELADPKIHVWRQKLRDSHRPKWPPCKVEGVRSLGEILHDNPILKPLLDND